MEVDMNHQAYVGTYRAAMEAATVELDSLFEEARRLRNRMEEIDSAINALKPLMGFSAEEQPATPTKQQMDAALGLVFA